MTVRVWNILVLGALSRPAGTSAVLLFEHFPMFSLAYNTSLSPYHTAAHLDGAVPEAQDRAHALLGGGPREYGARSRPRNSKCNCLLLAVCADLPL